MQSDNAAEPYCPGPPGRLSALSISHSKPVLYGAFGPSMGAQDALQPKMTFSGPGSAPPDEDPVGLHLLLPPERRLAHLPGVIIPFRQGTSGGGARQIAWRSKGKRV